MKNFVANFVKNFAPNCREEHSMDRYPSRLKLSENFERHWSIPISGEIHMDQSLVHTFSCGNSYGPMVLKVLQKFPLHWYWSMDGYSQELPPSETETSPKTSLCRNPLLTQDRNRTPCLFCMCVGVSSRFRTICCRMGIAAICPCEIKCQKELHGATQLFKYVGLPLGRESV